MARFKARVLGLVTVAAITIGIATLFFWQEPLQTAQAAQKESTYIVERGDSLISIAKRLGVSVDALAAANGMAVSDSLIRKQTLIVPSAQSSEATMQDVWAASTAEPTEEMMAEASPEATEEAMEEAATAEAWQESTVEPSEEMMAAAAPAAPSAVRTYQVKEGESLHIIAKKFGISVDALAAANGLQRNSGLRRGQTLIIPGSSQPAAPAAIAPPASAPMAETTPEPTEEMMEEATAEATEEMTEEATPEPTEAMMEEATAEATEEMMEEASPEPTDEMMEEPTAEAAEEMTEEATPAATEEMAEEPTSQPTEEMIEEATPTATEEMMEEPTALATEEATEEPTATPTEEMTEEANILDTITELGDFTILLEALEAAGLSETLTTDGPFTLLAPTDAAFEALPSGTIDGLLASSPDDLGQVLLYHILPGVINSSDFVDGVTIITAQGGTVTISITADGIMVNDATITISDIETSNGVIHVLDAVLLPSENMAAAPNGAAAPTAPEAASGDAASVIIAPVNITDTIAAARLWDEPEGNIALFSPIATGGYHSPIEIIGLSGTFEGNVAVNLTATDGTLLGQRMTLGGAEDHGFFHTNLRFFINEATEATLSILEIDMAEGSILNTVDTEITLIPGQRFIDVNSPVVGQAVCDPILVGGYSNTFEANVVLTLSKPDGDVLAQMPTIGGSMGIYRDFATPLAHMVDEATPLLLSVAETDASGILNTIDETIIPITLYPAYSAACY